LNASPNARELTEFCDRAGLIIPSPQRLTFPSWEPKRAIDHILISPHMDVSDVDALPVEFSDHRPLAMTLNLNNVRNG
ncbi:MAG: EEP domain-containing protein, partial [Pseudomonadota bacterium]